MKKRLLSLLLCLGMVFTLTPTAAFAATAVNGIDLTLKAPDVNQMPTDASVPETASTVVTNTRWIGRTWRKDGKFSGPSGYGAYVTVRIKDGVDRLFHTDRSKYTITINGNLSGADIGPYKAETYLMSVSEDRKEAEVFVSFDMKVVALGVTGGHKVLNAGDPLAREATEDRTDQTMDNITVRSVPESPDGTVQPYSWVITEMDVHAKEGYLLTSLEGAKKKVGTTEVFNRYEVLGLVADLEYKDPFNVHITFYQWVGPAKGEKLSGQMETQAKEWRGDKAGRYDDTYTEVGTAKLRDYLAPRLSPDGKKVDAMSNLHDMRAYAYSVPSMASGSDKWARVADSITILDDHAEQKFPGAVGRWYLIRQGSKVGYIPEAYVENAVTPGVINSDTPTAYPATQTVNLDGRQVEFQMYALKDANGNPTNYIKVRDLAKALTGSKAAFSVEWDGAVNLVSGGIYAPNGSEGFSAFTTPWPYTLPASPTKVNGVDSSLQAIVLTDKTGGGHTYYQLRDLGRALGFNVGWNLEKGVFIESGNPYSDS